VLVVDRWPRRPLCGFGDTDLVTPHWLHSSYADAVRFLWPAWGETWPALVLAGLTPLAFLGALRPTARPFLARYGYLALATYLLPLAAWINVPGTQPVILLGGNVQRLMIYALPYLLVLALAR
jgi:hypothetical protein